HRDAAIDAGGRDDRNGARDRDRTIACGIEDDHFAARIHCTPRGREVAARLAPAAGIAVQARTRHEGPLRRSERAGRKKKSEEDRLCAHGCLPGYERSGECAGRPVAGEGVALDLHRVVSCGRYCVPTVALKVPGVLLSASVLLPNDVMVPELFTSPVAFITIVVFDTLTTAVPPATFPVALMAVSLWLRMQP